MAPLLRVRRGRMRPGRPVVVAPAGAPRRRGGRMAWRGIVVIIALLAVAFLAWKALAA